MQSYQILSTLKDRLIEAGESDVLLKAKGEKGLETDLLLSFHTAFGRLAGTALGEYRFIELKDAGFSIFDCKVLITEDIAEDIILRLGVNIALVNNELSFGSFCFDPKSSSLSFRAQVPLVPELTDEEITEIADSTIAASLDMAGRYAGGLWDVMGGEAWN